MSKLRKIEKCHVEGCENSAGDTRYHSKKGIVPICYEHGLYKKYDEDGRLITEAENE